MKQSHLQPQQYHRRLKISKSQRSLQKPKQKLQQTRQHTVQQPQPTSSQAMPQTTFKLNKSQSVIKPKPQPTLQPTPQPTPNTNQSPSVTEPKPQSNPQKLSEHQTQQPSRHQSHQPLDQQTPRQTPQKLQPLPPQNVLHLIVDEKNVKDVIRDPVLAAEVLDLVYYGPAIHPFLISAHFNFADHHFVVSLSGPSKRLARKYIKEIIYNTFFIETTNYLWDAGQIHEFFQRNDSKKIALELSVPSKLQQTKTKGALGEDKDFGKFFIIQTLRHCTDLILQKQFRWTKFLNIIPKNESMNVEPFVSPCLQPLFEMDSSKEPLFARDIPTKKTQDQLSETQDSNPSSAAAQQKLERARNGDQLKKRKIPLPCTEDSINTKEEDDNTKEKQINLRSSMQIRLEREKEENPLVNKREVVKGKDLSRGLKFSVTDFPRSTNKDVKSDNGMVPSVGSQTPTYENRSFLIDDILKRWDGGREEKNLNQQGREFISEHERSLLRSPENRVHPRAVPYCQRQYEQNDDKFDLGFQKELMGLGALSKGKDQYLSLIDNNDNNKDKNFKYVNLSCVKKKYLGTASTILKEREEQEVALEENIPRSLADKNEILHATMGVPLKSNPLSSQMSFREQRYNCAQKSIHCPLKNHDEELYPSYRQNYGHSQPHPPFQQQQQQQQQQQNSSQYASDILVNGNCKNNFQEENEDMENYQYGVPLTRENPFPLQDSILKEPIRDCTFAKRNQNLFYEQESHDHLTNQPQHRQPETVTYVDHVLGKENWNQLPLPTNDSFLFHRIPLKDNYPSKNQELYSEAQNYQQQQPPLQPPLSYISCSLKRYCYSKEDQISQYSPQGDLSMNANQERNLEMAKRSPRRTTSGLTSSSFYPKHLNCAKDVYPDSFYVRPVNHDTNQHAVSHSSHHEQTNHISFLQKRRQMTQPLSEFHSQPAMQRTE
eukprot:Awhi_evm1s1474